ncbi:hypothetical protein PVL29_016621 [Vitis rotundifolia]|uniref:RING-type E3 ubiquitin transferase n=1 Tax=Vitis rotundifolia TaxID=103349 RepID=A0AA38Z8Z4_VITRO|nr:hypothetical protein PVL29_016621 [Vitis rotundifolia]
MAEDKPINPILSKLAVVLAGIASAAVVVTIYRCIAISCRNRGRQRSHRERLQQLMYQRGDQTPSSVNNSAALLMIPAHKYHKGMELVGNDDGVCAVCLSEFEEGEELRTLPECMHSFHVACIDMWLYSHTNCPLCRSNATPSPLLQHGLPESSSGGLTDVVVQSPRL